MPSAIIHEMKTADLKPHPANATIYGDETLPADFLESIKTLGVIEPLLVRTDGTIISGHRRWLAAKKAGLATVPTRTGDFADELEEIEMLISSNKQREKSKTQIFREGEELQRIEKERADRRMRLGKKPNPTQSFGEGGETDEHVAKALGMSSEQWRKIKTIFAKAQQGDESAQELVKALDAGTVSVHKAYKALYRSYQEKQREVDDLKANPKKEIVFEAPSEVVRELESLKSEKIRLQGEKSQLEERISKARAEKKDVDDLLRKKASLQEALKELVKQKDEQETYVQYATELATALQDIRRLLESKKGTIERLAKTGIPGAWDAKHVMDVRDLCYEFGELLTTSISTVSVWGSVKKEDEE